jgi:hypothetical protein
MDRFSTRKAGLFVVILKNITKNIWFSIRYKNRNLTDAHFAYWSSANHVNRRAFEFTIEALGNNPSTIIETGTAAWGTNSTRLWDAYVRKNGGSLISVDIRPEASARLAKQLSKLTKCEISDSVVFLESNQHVHADLYFLDSWDVDWANPHASAMHGLAEFEAISRDLRSGNLVLIDDTPVSTEYIPYRNHPEAKSYFESHQVWPGKGALVLKQIQESDEYQVLFHEYALLFRKK